MGGATGSSPEENRGGHIPRTTEHLPHCLQRYKQYKFHKVFKVRGVGEDMIPVAWITLLTMAHCKRKWVVFNPFWLPQFHAVFHNFISKALYDVY